MGTSPKVYVVQIPKWYDPSKKGWVNKYDISTAREFGTITTLLPSGNVFRDRLTETMALLKEELKAYTENDSILALGDPVAIAAAIMAASRATNGTVNVLKFDKASQKYISFHLVLES